MLPFAGPTVYDRNINRTLIMKTTLLFFLTFILLPINALADDLDVLADPSTPPDQRGEIYQKLAKADLASIGIKLATLIGTHGVISDFGPRTKQPWNEPQLSENDRVEATLLQLWADIKHNEKIRGQNFDTMLSILENPAVGSGRYMVLSELSSSLRFRDPSQPPLDVTLKRLDALAQNENERIDFRMKLVATLFEYADPNAYLDFIIKLSSKEPKPLDQSEAFRFSTPEVTANRLTKENQKRYLEYAFSLLKSIDDGHSGTGYFLARHIGVFLGIKGEFAPDSHLPEYQGQYSLKDSFFQQTVDNARTWWANNSSLY